MSETAKRDPFLDRAREEAEGTELVEDFEQGGSLEKQREQAQGVELFEDPDATLPVEALKEGPPGEESLTGDGVDPGSEEEEVRQEGSDEPW